MSACSSRAAIFANCVRAVFRSSTISAATTWGAGNESVSVRLSSLIQNRSTPVTAKSASLRVTTVRRWQEAVAAIRPSTAGTLRDRATRRPHSSATLASTERTRSSNQRGNAVSSHPTIRARWRPPSIFSMPLRISPSVRTLMNRVSGFAASNQSRTKHGGLGLVNSESVQVSIRKLVDRCRAVVTGHA